METGPPLNNNMATNVSRPNVTRDIIGGVASASVIPFRRWPCEGCDRTFSSPSVRDRHMRIHTREKRWACHYPGCSKRYTRHEYLQSHRLTHEKVLGHVFASLPPKGVTYLEDDDDDPQQDNVNLDILLRDADQAVDDTDALRFQAIQAGRFPCHYCQKIYARSDCRKRHSRIHTGDKQHVCHVTGCGMAFYRADHLDGHLKTHAGRSFVDSTTAEEIVKLSTVSNAASTVSAPNPANASNQPASPSSHETDHPMTAHGTFLVVTIECELCGELFDTPADKKRHIVSTHVDQKPWICLQTHCGGCFAPRDALHRHESLHQEGNDTAAQDHQDTASKTVSRFIAPGAVPSPAAAPKGEVHHRGFACQHEGCGQVFKGPNKLIEHQKVHNDPKPFKCPICGKGLSRKDKLTVHIRLHNDQKQVIDLPPVAPATSTKRQRVKMPNARPPRDLLPRPRYRPPVLQPGQHHVCHLCGENFGRSNDLRRHVASSVHTSSANGNCEGDLRPKLDAQKDLQCAECGKAFERRADRDRHMGSPNVHRDVWRPDQRSFGTNMPIYAQECIGCGQAFTEETAFYSHAPCYQPAATIGEHSSAEDGEDIEKEAEDTEHVMEETTLLDDFEAQLLAAANDASHEQIQGNGQRQVVAHDPGPDAASSPHAAFISYQGVAHSGLNDESKRGLRVQDSPVRTAPSDQAIVPRLVGNTTTAVRNADANQFRSAAPQHSRLCYGCGKVFWDSKGFWTHGPCFTKTTGKPGSPAPAPTPAESLKEDTLDTADLNAPCAILKQHNASSESAKLAMAEPVVVKGKGRDYLDTVINVAPSPEVQRLLVNLAKNNPDARPIPPRELHGLIHRGPDMLALVTKMERDNAEIQLWLKNNQKGRTTQHSAEPDTAVASKSS